MIDHLLLELRDVSIAGQTFVNVDQDTLDGLLDVWLDGMADDSAGDVDYGIGHFFRVGESVVKTDGHGFTYPYTFRDEQAAQDYMDVIHRIYAALDEYEEN